MADEPQQPQQPSTPGKKKGGGRGMQVAVLALLMLGEGVAVFFVSRAMNTGPASVEAADDAETEAEDGGDQFVEIELAECSPSNKMTGKIINFRLRVIGLIAKDDAERAKELVEGNKARILDRINYVIRSAEPAQLNEPELSTLERRLKQEFDRMFGGEELIQQVLIPELQQSGSGL